MFASVCSASLLPAAATSLLPAAASLLPAAPSLLPAAAVPAVRGNCGVPVADGCGGAGCLGCKAALAGTAGKASPGAAGHAGGGGIAGPGEGDLGGHSPSSSPSLLEEALLASLLVEGPNPQLGLGGPRAPSPSPSPSGGPAATATAVAGPSHSGGPATLPIAPAGPSRSGGWGKEPGSASGAAAASATADAAGRQAVRRRCHGARPVLYLLAGKSAAHGFTEQRCTLPQCAALGLLPLLRKTFAHPERPLWFPRGS